MLSPKLLFCHTSISWSLKINLTPEHSDCKSNVVITRTAKPKPGMIDRMKQFSSDIKNDPQVKFMAVVDDKHGTNLILPLPQDEIFHYSYDDIAHAFPVWQDRTALEFFGKHPPDNYYFHMESIFLAVDFVEKNNKDICDHARYWVFEDDVFMCGSIVDLIHYYDETPGFSDTDLLDGGQGRNGLNEWGSYEYKKRYPSHSRVMHAEHVQRFSKRLLTHMRNLVEHNITAESEWFAPTVAKNDGFKHEAFSKEHLGVYAWNGKLTKDEADAECQKDGKKLSINHAGKFYKNQDSNADESN